MWKAGYLKYGHILYFANTSIKVSIGKRAAENAVTAMLCYYSKTLPGMEWLRAPKCYSLGIVGSYLFRHTTGLLIR